MAAPMCNAGPEVVLQIYYEWCKWLEFPQELPHIVLERLYQGGEYLRSLLQFMARSSEPHRRNDADDAAEWRSQNAMQTTCALFTAPGWGAPNTLAATCLELLGGLQPGCQGFSLHICTVLQHLLIAHEREVLTLLLHYQTPFVLLRALNRPGCSEILQILLGADAVLPKLVPHISMRPLQVHSLQQVRQYLLAFQWPRYLEAVMSGAIAASLESREPASSPPRTPISQVNYDSPGPTLLDPLEQGKVTPCSTPQRWLCGTPEATPFQSLEAHKSSPSEERESSSLRCMTTPQKQVLCTPPRRTSELIARDSPEDPQEASRGVGVLLDFLSSILHAFKRSDQVAERSLARMAEDWESQERAKVQVLLLKDFFIDVPLVSSLCLLIGKEFESASLLNSLLQHALQIQGSQPEVVDALVTQCLQQLDAIFSALGLQLLKMRSSVTQGRSEALRLNGYVVQEPLGALRVEVVQIVSVLSRLAPERFLPLVKPAVWSAFAKWFFMYRCNHIFQAACSKLWVQVIRYGSQKLQYHIFINLRLFSGLCDAILTEGTCGDRWHNLTPAADRCGDAQRMEKRQVTTSRARHPGGLGAIVQVVRALADTVAKPQVFTERKPLAEKLPQTQTQVISKETKVQEQQSFLKKMVSASSLWPQVLKALPPPAKAVKIVATVTKSSAPFDI